MKDVNGLLIISVKPFPKDKALVILHLIMKFFVDGVVVHGSDRILIPNIIGCVQVGGVDPNWNSRSWQLLCRRDNIPKIDFWILFDDWEDVVHHAVVRLKIGLAFVDVVGIEMLPIRKIIHDNRLFLVKQHVNRDVLVRVGDFAAFVDCSLQVHIRVGAAIDEMHIADRTRRLESDRDRSGGSDRLTLEGFREGLIKSINLSIINIDRLEGHSSLKWI